MKRRRHDLSLSLVVTLGVLAGLRASQLPSADRATAAAPAGSTGAVLSLVDAAAGRVEVVRHWPGASRDVDVYPFVPYFWDGCPGPGAILLLLTGMPGGPPPLVRAARALSAARTSSGARLEIDRIAASLIAPGDPLTEVAKDFLPIADLASYERNGYAVFLFIRWVWWRCAVEVRAVPEGYGIPFVR